LLGNEPDLNRHIGSAIGKTSDAGVTKHRINRFADPPKDRVMT
jgi:hypothetical protein